MCQQLEFRRSNILTVMEFAHSMVEKQGYMYILGTQRFPEGNSWKKAGNRIPVLLEHSLLMLLLPPHQSLAFLLADNGFDVWIANACVTKYSRGHVSLSPHDKPYWTWTWDELVAYDFPATIHYVHDQTGQKLHYVGHSLGPLIALAAFSRHQLMDMLRSAALLCSIAHVSHIASPFTRNAVNSNLAELSDIAKVLESYCKKPGVNCYLKPSIVDAFLANEPQPTTTKNMIHLSQSVKFDYEFIRDGMIKMFDYGDKDQNMKYYGQPHPPAYDMTNIPNDFPLFLSYGDADTISDRKDVHLLLKSLKGNDGDKLVVLHIDDYAHANFVMGGNAKQVVYDTLMAFLRLQ
ncbi:hypothetical protein UlMin_014219 [Ulmus minor]